MKETEIYNLVGYLNDIKKTEKTYDFLIWCRKNNVYMFTDTCKWSFSGMKLTREELFAYYQQEIEKQLQRKAYEAYQLDWMQSHGYGLQDIFNVMREYYVEAAMDGNLDSNMNVACDAAEEYFDEQGFDGNIFASFDEFLKCEYTDAPYMEHLLTKADYELYISFMGKKV